MPESCDLAVIGAGPAGCAASILAARRGLRVIMADRASFPRRKPCGGCIGATGDRLMRDLGLAQPLENATRASAAALRLATPNRRVRIPMRGGRIVDRAAFDASLVELASSCGVVVRQGVRVRAIEQRGSRVRVDAGDSIDASVAVVSCGLGAGPSLCGIPERVAGRSYIGIGTHVRDTSDAYEPGEMFMHAVRDGYVGIVRIDHATLDVALASDPRATRSLGVAGFVADALRQTGAPVPEALADAEWKGTPALTRTPASVASGRVLLAGDSAGYVEPFTGEGMTWAVASGALASAAACDWLADPGFDLARAYTRAHARRVARRRRACRVVRAALRRPALLDGAVAAASLSQRFSGAVVSVFERPYRVIGATP